MRTVMIVSLSCVALLGCKPHDKPEPQPTPPNPAPVAPCPTTADLPQVTVPLNVIRILHDPDGPGPAARDVTQGEGLAKNTGCRLSWEQIAQYIDHADQFCRQHFNIHLHWNPNQQVNDPNDPNNTKKETFYNLYGIVQGSPDRYYRPFELFEMEELQKILPVELNPDGEGFYVRGKLNIIFHGNIRFFFLEPPSGQQQWQNLNGNTVDPSDAGWLDVAPGIRFFIYPHILINDRGFITKSGQFVPDDNVLEHELAHFFLRRRGASPYDEREHYDLPDHLMKTHPPHGQNLTDAGGICESYEIFIQAGNFPCPTPQTCTAPW